MSKGKEAPKSYAQRLDVLETRLKQFSSEKDAAEKRFFEKYGSDAQKVTDLQRDVYAKLRKIPGVFCFYNDFELKIMHDEPFPAPVESLVQELYALRGDPPVVFWSPNWRCRCGNNTTFWRRLGNSKYSIFCEACMKRCGNGTDDDLVVAQRVGAFVLETLKETQQARFHHYMYTKDLSERLNVDMRELPKYINTIDRTIESYVEELKDLPAQIAERKAREQGWKKCE